MKYFSTVWNFFLELVFPKICIGCGEFGNFCCAKCLAKIKAIKTQVCPKCGKISDRGKFCSGCKGDLNLTGLIVSADYNTGPTKELIHHLKYNRMLEISDALADLMIDQLIDVEFRGKVIVASVPLHSKRQRERGFNQSEVLAKKVAKSLGYEYLSLLKRIKQTKSQVELSGERRRENLIGAFVADGSLTEGKTVILVDDVSTTGSTLEECAKELRKSGVRQVWGLVVSKR